MRKLIYFFTSLILVFMLVAAAIADAIDIKAERWLSATGMSIEFKANGTADVTYKNGKTASMPWEQNGNTIRYYFEYQLFGTTQKYYYNYLLSETDGHPQLVAKKKDVILYPESVMKQLLEQAAGMDVQYKETAFGSKLKRDFVEITIKSSAASTTMSAPSGKGTSISAQKDGNTMFYLTGVVSNTGLEEICVGAAYVTFDFGNGKTYWGEAYVDDGENGLVRDLPVLSNGTIYLGVEVPKSVLKAADSCRVRLDFDDGMKLIPAYPQAAEYHYEIVLGKKDIRTKAAPVKYDMVYFKEFPKLPTPQSYANVYVASSSSSTFNKKLRQATYIFKARDESLKLKSVVKNYVKKIKKLGFSVKKKGSKWKIKKGKTEMFTITIEGSQIVFKYSK